MTKTKDNNEEVVVLKQKIRNENVEKRDNDRHLLIIGGVSVGIILLCILCLCFGPIISNTLLNLLGIGYY